MSTTVVFVRHGSHDLLGTTLCGRMQGVSLNAQGRRQADAAAQRLRGLGLAALYTSPRDRCRETAAPIAAAVGVEAVTEPALDEIDFGDWSGARFDALEGRPDWTAWNTRRSAARPPNGETMDEARSRVTGWLDQARRRHPDATVAAVSHGDVIKAALLAALGLGVDDFERIDVDPGGLSTVVLGAWGMKVHSINEAAA